jgi:hypothetical protein
MCHIALTQRHVLSRQHIQRRYLGVVGFAEADVGHGSGDVHYVTSRATTPYSTWSLAKIKRFVFHDTP